MAFAGYLLLCFLAGVLGSGAVQIARISAFDGRYGLYLAACAVGFLALAAAFWAGRMT